jgi:acyl-coenzyme A thioesterase PaaI-like protein
MRQRTPEHGPCLVCTEFGTALYWDGEKVEAEFTPSEKQQGPPGHAHGGALTAVMDECMGGVAWAAGRRALLARIEVDCRKPVPLGTRCRVEARVERAEGRKVWCASRLILPDGTIAAESRALFVEPKAFAPVGSGA